jgi:DUF4097 and DUF4098 domain-containing protein YvlB
MKRSAVIILLILALALVGTGILAVAFFALGRPALEFARPVVYATAEETKSLDVDGPFTLDVQNDAGKVSIVGGETDQVTVKVVKTGIAATQARAEQDLKNIHYEIEQQGDTIRLAYDLEELDLRRDPGSVDTVDFIVTVPPDVTVEVSSVFGNVELEGISGGVDLRTESGFVEASSIDAGSEDIRLDSKFGSVRLTDATGAEIVLHSDSGILEAKNVRASQEMELSTQFGGVTFENGSAGSLKIVTQSGAVELTSIDVRGALVVEDFFGNINLEKVRARSYDARTDSGSITMDGVGGPVKANSGFGNITLKNAENATLDLDTQSGAVDFEGSLGEGPHTIHSSFGEIRLSIPADSALDVDLLTNFGTIKSDIPITVTLSGETDRNRQTGTMNDGGAQLKVEAGSGGISIQARR